MHPTPGYKTTEFWLTIVANIVGGLLTSGLITNDNMLKVLGIVAMILSSLGYTVARAMVKGKISPVPALPRPDPAPYEDESAPDLLNEKILAVVNPGEEAKIVLFRERKKNAESLVIQIVEGAEAFSIENIVIGGEAQWTIPMLAFVFKSQPIVVYEKNPIKPTDEIAIVIKNRSDEQRKIFGEAAVVVRG